MPTPGSKPKDRKAGRYRMVQDWTEIEDVPYAGPVPVVLPERRELMTQFGPKEFDVTPAAKEWWERVQRMPHCVLWSEGDWVFALATALVADVAAKGTSSANAELRQREKILGLTGDARRDLRIRYVPAGSLVENRNRKPKAEAVKVDDLTARRARLAS